MRRDEEPSAEGNGDDKPSPASPYPVGYGKPPRETRFRKGHSGNPRGRPKGEKSAKSLFDQALSAPVTISEGGRMRVVEQRTALFKALVAKAIKGDARAAALVVRLMNQFGFGANDEAHLPITTIRRVIVRTPDRRPTDEVR
jgi:hypothetical protein